MGDVMMSATFEPEPSRTRLHLPAELRGEVAAWVEAGYPFETCGLLIGRAGDERIEVERVTAAANLRSERSTDRYLVDPDAWLAADEAARRDGLDVVGIWHSHPDCPARPSTTDLEAAWEGYSYLIVAVTGEGDFDFRSWRLAGELFREEQILPEAPRPAAPALRFETPLKEELSMEDRQP
jgi:proteasome lid subunit RPN8/RPN11